MDDKQIEGGAGPALAAHSKDAAGPGPTPAVRMTAAGAPSSAPDQAIAFVRERPLTALLAAVGVGFMVGMALPRR